ncbi:hypothetical protein ABB37_09897 [Leptomonas pyrrhocoris]|uniref:Uncharacterized protein n=1 Tax=Leptomonas pyrrhocoris TaxID=157538 RepID=A0A0M9FPG3_LEPPY|nr:hypothetical protein ABB37_09897 [Leptomonas pyrrhocoris]KPA73337.1 hypothetical protein ABB37_09897 [Leptomonas pyrrhocoris]|eukprot:XP_015651776.1 hypothetical protein ABB37_09897 [Leptomonas pyrrhocoris]
MGKPNKSRKKAAVKPLRQRPAEHHEGGCESVNVLPIGIRSDSNAAANLAASLPPCVQQLRESTEYAVLEDACSDVALFALQAKRNEAFLREGVPQRLTQLLLFTPPYAAEATTEEGNTDNRGKGEEAGDGTPQLRKDILYVQLAAADALRSLVTNSEQDRVVDALTGIGVVDPVSGLSFAEGLAALVREDWSRVQEARRRMTPNDWMEVFLEENDAGGDDAADGAAAQLHPHEQQPQQQHELARRRRGAGNTRNIYFTLLRHLEEVLALAGVCVEANEVCAATFSDASVLCLLLDVLRVATTTTWETLLHPSARYFADDTEGVATSATAATTTTATASDAVLAMRAYKRREAALLASLAVSTSEVLLLLSPENPSLTHLLTTAVESAPSASSSSSTSSAAASPGVTAEQRSFLRTAVDAVDLRAWLAEKPPAEVQLQERFSDAALPGFVGPLHTPVALERERVLYTLLRVTLSMQGMLLHVAPVTANVQRVLPLLCDALLKVSLPMHVWCGLLPILMDTCEVGDEELRSAVTLLAMQRLRSTQSAVRLLHVVANVVGEQSDARRSAEQDDEAAFAANPLTTLLQSSSVFYAFGLLLKDVLWISQRDGGEGSSGGTDVVTQQAQQRALRAEAASNAAATELQMVLLSTEVNVWEVASTLLLMLPVASLGDPSRTWRALMLAVQHRYELHLNAAAAAAAFTAAEQRHQQEQMDRTMPANIAQHSANAHQLIWLQLESLGQMLWTMQRKQSKAYSGDGLVVAATAAASHNDVQATAADVDVLVRISWESAASASLKQACVGAVGLLCASMQEPEAVATATRFALAVVANGGPSVTFHRKLMEAFNGLVAANVPVDAAARRQWMQQLSVVDAAATVRSEAANTLVDLFLDERYDAAVYWPFGVQESLKNFALQLAAYVRRRAQLDAATQRKLGVSMATPEAEQWAELLENLDGFLDYKARHKR